MRNQSLKRARLLALLVGLALLPAQNAIAFEVASHGAITAQAWLRFSSEDSTILERLGIQDRPNVFATDQYYNYRANGTSLLFTANVDQWYENIVMRRYLGISDNLSIIGWLVRGAIREDDDSFPPEGTSRDDAFGNFHRVFSHFMDPAYGNHGLQVRGLTLGASAVSWALDSNAITPQYFSEPARFNHYNLPNWRESMWRAITGLNKEGEVVAAIAGMRNRYWATAFISLGSVLHLNQDMAQPQHSRNDSHGGMFPDLVGHKSVFERYLEARVKGLPGFSTKDDPTSIDVPIALQPISFGPTYPIPKFARFQDYWSTSDNKGLANYSNRGFFSVQTLPGSIVIYPNPPTLMSQYVKLLQTLTRWDGSPVLGGVLRTTLYNGNVTDLLTGQTAIGVSLFSRSIWDQAAQDIGLPSRARLVKANYDDAINLLVPRAVAYSAGILQYAFRGKLEITPPSEGIYALADHALSTVNAAASGGFRRIKVKARNITDAIPNATGGADPQWMQANGDIRAVVKFRRNNCYEPDTLMGQPGAVGYDATCKTTTDEIVVSERQYTPLAINSSEGHEFTFEFPGVIGGPIPINATDVVLQIVYRGPLGLEEDAVVIGTKNIAEPSFYNFDNYSDCYRLADGTFQTRAGQYMSASMSFNGGATYNASVVNLPPGRYSRYAVLADLGLLPTKEASGSSYQFETLVNQNINDVPIAAPLIKAARLTSDGRRIYAYEGFGLYPTPNYEGTEACPTAIAPAPTPMNIVFQ